MANVEDICIGNGRDNCDEGIGGDYDYSPDGTENASCSDDTTLKVRATRTPLMWSISVSVMVETIVMKVLVVIMITPLMELRMLRVLMTLH